MTRLFLFFTGLLFFQCANKEPSIRPSSQAAAKSMAPGYARGFDYQKKNNLREVIVKNPWQLASGVVFQYFLCDTFVKSEVLNDHTCRIKTPVKRVVCLSTTHIGFINYLHSLSSIVGLSGKDYVVNDSLRTALAKGEVLDVGYDENLNYELILDLRPDIVFAYGINMAVTGTIKKLNELGIPVVMIGEYLEEDPLAKMEWVKLFASFYNLENLAVSRFDSAVTRYNNLKATAQKAPVKPSVLLGLPWRGTWYISGSRSYVARLVKDAAGRYIWNHLNFNESRPMALEAVYEQALQADYWLNTGDAWSRNDILSLDERFSGLPAFTNGRLYNNNNRLSEKGGNDIFESGVVEPDAILADLIYILHPQLLPSHRLKYYRKVE
jgi:iron complex transport system substrate-binding protein